MFNKKREVISNIFDISKTIANRCLRRGYGLNSEKLHTMMIIAYGEYLAKTGKRLFDSKIVITSEGIFIDNIQEITYTKDYFEKLFPEEKVYLCEVEVVFKNLINTYGDKSLIYVKNDPRLRALNEIKKRGKNLSDKEILNVFTRVPKPEIETHILCDASEKAKWIINGCLKKGYNINTFKLEKLLVLAYGESLVKTSTKLFNERIVIWESGAMVKEVDQDFRRYAMGFYAPFYEYHLKLEAQEKLIDYIICKYGKKDGFELNENIKLKELAKYKNSDGFVSDDDIKRVFEKYMV